MKIKLTMIKRLILSAFYLTFFTMAGAQPIESNKTYFFILNPESSLKIIGKSNVNEFTCALSPQFKRDTLAINFIWGKEFVICNDASIRFQVSDFVCENPTMTRDLQYTLNADQYPEISMDIQKLILSPEMEENMQLMSEVDIRIANKRHKFRTLFREIIIKENVVSFIGKQTISLDQFGLVPPKILFGLIKIEDHMDVLFELHINRISPDRKPISKSTL